MKQPKQTLVPGKVYRNVGGRFNGRFSIAVSETHFLTDRDGCTAMFTTEQKAVSAYRTKKGVQA